MARSADIDDEGEGMVVLDSSLCEVVNSDTLKWVFVGGKGGVGKTTTACSTAIQFAKTRESVLILSTDPAHNVSDALNQQFSGQPTLVKGFDNLYAMELDTSLKTGSASSFFQSANTEASAGAFSPSNLSFLSSLPGIDEAVGFAELMQSVKSFDHSVIVFDTAPTGHTLRLLSFPDVIERALKKLSAYRDKIFGTLNMLNSLSGNTMDIDELNDHFDTIKAITAQVKETFQDPTLTTFVCVCIPEFLSLYETERLIQELTRQNIDCSNIVINQVLFPEGEDYSLTTEDYKILRQQSAVDANSDKSVRLLLDRALNRLEVMENSHNARRRMQMKYLNQIQDLYAEYFHVVCMAMQAKEVRGINELTTFGTMLLSPRPLPPPPPEDAKNKQKQ